MKVATESQEKHPRWGQDGGRGKEKKEQGGNNLDCPRDLTAFKRSHLMSCSVVPGAVLSGEISGVRSSGQRLPMDTSLLSLLILFPSDAISSSKLP